MLFVADSVQLAQLIPFQGSSLKGLGDFKIEEQVIRTVKYADDLVILAKEETVLQCMIDRFL